MKRSMDRLAFRDCTSNFIVGTSSPYLIESVASFEISTIDEFKAFESVEFILRRLIHFFASTFIEAVVVISIQYEKSIVTSCPRVGIQYTH